ncbi:MAG: polysaccharide deacetylase family protein [Lachnospiraceae bacterium]|nr:polysaccharide deacetylase family protein [Lachnospiraceae bacterium]
MKRKNLAAILSVFLLLSGCGIGDSGPTVPEKVTDGANERMTDAEEGSERVLIENGTESGLDGNGAQSEPHVEDLYRTDSAGAPAQGWYTDPDGSVGYCGTDGYLLTGFHVIEGFRYLFLENGDRVTGEYVDEAGELLMFTEDGKQYLNTTARRADGNLYFFEADGTLASGEVTFADGKKGWAEEDGRLRVGCHLIDGVVYNYGTSGKFIRTIDANQPMVALTYDDGPGQYIDELLACLTENDSLATFYVIGKKAVHYQDRLQLIAKQGSEFGNHTYDHYVISKLSESESYIQIIGLSDLVESATGERPATVRPPTGEHDAASLARMAALDKGYPVIMWSIDTLDWQHQDPNIICEKIRAGVRDGSIILMHDPVAAMLTASRIMIPELISMGYQLVTVSEMAAARGGMTGGKAYFHFYPEDVPATTAAPVQEEPGIGSLSEAPGAGMPSEAPEAGMPSEAPEAGMPSEAPGAGMPSEAPGAGMPSEESGIGVPPEAPGAESLSEKPGAGMSSENSGDETSPAQSAAPGISGGTPDSELEIIFPVL